MTRSMIRDGFRASPLALAMAVALAPAAHAAEDPAAPRKTTDLDKVEVVAKDQKPSSVKYTAPLLDTPQTITVVNREQMEQQNLLGLRDVLSTLPGITFGAGEGGGGYGDSITLRGFNANTDITTDGVRDSAQYSRTDSFNLESIELINGANSVYSGAGSVGGNINLVSKFATLGDFTTMQVGAGTDDYGRITFDGNTDFQDGSAFRINAMAHKNDAPGRDVETFERWGIAPSLAFGLGSPTRFTINYFHQTDNNIPQYGVPYFSAYGGTLPGVDKANYYGYRDVDTQDIDLDMLTGVFEHDFGQDTTLRSLARYQVADQLSVVDAPQGTWCLAGGVNASPAPGATCLAGQTPGTFRPGAPSGPRGYVRDTSNSIAISQTDLTTRVMTGTVEHALVAGLSFTRETFDLDTGNLFREPNGAVVSLPEMSIAHPINVYGGSRNYIRTSLTEGHLDNTAAYLFDNLKFDEHWTLNLGARYEYNKGDTVVDTFDITADSPTLGQPNKRDLFENAENLFSWRAGLVYKPVETGTVYFAYSDSKTPSKASVNGACTLQTCNVDPESAVTLELGTKWDIGKRLAVNASVFRNERQEYKVADPSPLNPSGEQQLDGTARVDGIALGIAGQLTHAWSIFANATFLDSEVLQGVSDACLAAPGTACGNSVAVPDPLAGRPISGTPERAANIWTTYVLERWTFGYGTSYQGGYAYYTGLAANAGDIKGYTAHRAMVAFDVNDQLSLQLNATNLFDKTYYIRVRNNGWATPGDARSLVLSATFRF